MREVVRDISFYSKPPTQLVKEVSLFIAGRNSLAERCHKVFLKRRERILSHLSIDLALRGGGSLETVASLASTSFCPNRVVIDCSCDSEASRFYPSLISSGARVVSLNTAALERQELLEGVHLEALLGGGLPLLSTIRDLRVSGDAILGISIAARQRPLSSVMRTIAELAGWHDYEERTREGITRIVPSDPLRYGMRDDEVQRLTLPPSDIAYLITTTRYWESPIVLQGPRPGEELLAHTALQEVAGLFRT